MFEKIIESLAVQFPAIAILLVAVAVLYRDIKNERKDAKKEREDTIAVAYDTKMRIERIELEITGEKMPTLFKRTPEMQARIESAISRPQE
jgi:hypothetical protein